MYEKTLGLLEFDNIRRKVADAALSEEAAERIRGELPRLNPQETAELKALVSAAVERIAAGDGEKREYLPSVSFLLPKLGVAGTALETDEAFALGLFVERGETLKQWFLGGTAGETANPLRTLAAEVPDCTGVSREVFRVLDKEGNFRDLPEFREIRRRIRGLTRDLDALIARYTLSEDSRQFLQSTVPSQRDGRIVLAVKANFRKRVQGIVHEISATGQTLFVEPGEVVEKNNDILIEQRKLDAEILRVLREMTARIAEHRESLRKFHECIVYLETIRARARYSVETRGHFAGSGAVTLIQARHPLLGSQAVPIDFAMHGDTRAVIITGPNTGGKTATLKTVGLFALMNQFGLALPAEEGTALPIFDGVYADIGDEQSLSQSLSTFSAHMTAIAAITQVSTDRSLVLLDELGSGTDPEEGSAIALAILDYLMEKDVILIVTTHHGVLKNYGYAKPKAENASVEFDGRTLSPTYRVLLGLPGESRAVDIAARNGLQAAIISRARSYLAEGRSDVSALITGLKLKQRELLTAEELRRQEELRLREERRKADLKELRLRQKEAELKAAGAGNLRRLLEESRKTLENLVREVREGELTREKTLKVKEFLSELDSAVALQDAALAEERQSLAEDIRRAEEAEKPRKGTQRIEPGAEVLAGGYKRPGIALRPDKKGAWIVEIGSLRMTFPEKDLRLVSPPKTANKPVIDIPELSSAVTPQCEISLRGMRLDEALDALQRQLDAAAMAGLREFSVIHGKGDGILQKGVWEFLKTQPQVADYCFSRPEQGGFGRTEVSLKI
ncbi:MAG: endonuclease MutS2 [Spirochaetaceae bacterium]|jgi:DNA mismatch repair protein MutS2|nr:endonuclease MutS2 [Spirochaetaceae bacterium]